MNFIVWILVGGALGGLASLAMPPDGEQSIFINVVVGLIGALIGGWLLSPLLGAGIINDGAFNFGSLLVSLAGAAILLAVVNLLGRRRAR